MNSWPPTWPQQGVLQQDCVFWLGILEVLKLVFVELTRSISRSTTSLPRSSTFTNLQIAAWKSPSLTSVLKNYMVSPNLSTSSRSGLAFSWHALIPDSTAAVGAMAWFGTPDFDKVSSKHIALNMNWKLHSWIHTFRSEYPVCSTFNLCLSDLDDMYNRYLLIAMFPAPMSRSWEAGPPSAARPLREGWTATDDGCNKYLNQSGCTFPDSTKQTNQSQWFWTRWLWIPQGV